MHMRVHVCDQVLRVATQQPGTIPNLHCKSSFRAQINAKWRRQGKQSRSSIKELLPNKLGKLLPPDLSTNMLDDHHSCFKFDTLALSNVQSAATTKCHRTYHHSVNESIQLSKYPTEGAHIAVPETSRVVLLRINIVSRCSQ